MAIIYSLFVLELSDSLFVLELSAHTADADR